MKGSTRAGGKRYIPPSMRPQNGVVYRTNELLIGRRMGNSVSMVPKDFAVICY